MVSRKHKAKMNEMLISLYVQDNIKEMLDELSDEYGVPKSQIMSYAMLAMKYRVSKAIDILPRYLVPSKAARWKNNLNLEQFEKDFGG